MTQLAMVALLATAASGCCCCGDGGGFLSPEHDDRGAEEAARRYYQEHADELAAQLAPDGGPSGGCLSGLGALAMSVAVAVVSRGHAGGDSAAEVSVDPGVCFDDVIVLVVLTNGVWRAVGAVAPGVAGGEARVGSVDGYLLQERVERTDDDFGSDELF